jgi:RNA polymerase sigma-70 factor (sigma-E family)
VVEFVPFVEARRESLRRTAWVLTGDEQLADDLVQTALLKVWPRWARIVEHGDPEAYVRKTIYTTYLSWWQRRWRGERPTERLPERLPEVEDRSSVEMSPTLLIVLATLPPRQRAVIACRYLDDLSEKQTAEVLSCSVGTVKSQASRALQRLRELVTLADLVEMEDR